MSDYFNKQFDEGLVQEKDYINYQKDFNDFIKFSKNLYLKQYLVNSANNLVTVFINNPAYVIDTNAKSNEPSANNISKFKIKCLIKMS